MPRDECVDGGLKFELELISALVDSSCFKDLIIFFFTNFPSTSVTRFLGGNGEFTCFFSQQFSNEIVLEKNIFNYFITRTSR